MKGRFFHRALPFLALFFPGSGAYGGAPLPPGVQAIAVPQDTPVYALPGAGTTPEVVVYLHGHCGDPLAGLRSFPKAASEAGTLLSVQGDIPCKGRPGRRRWSTDAAGIQRRVDAAIEAASRGLGRPLKAAEVTLMGYSEGALRAELLATTFPARYPRVILGGEPRAPRAAGFTPQQAVATLAGERDAQQPMREGAKALEEAGVRARFWVLPQARHGQYGPAAEQVLGEVFGWLSAPR
jgi:predicted esterase